MTVCVPVCLAARVNNGEFGYGRFINSELDRLTPVSAIRPDTDPVQVNPGSATGRRPTLPSRLVLAFVLRNDPFSYRDGRRFYKRRQLLHSAVMKLTLLWCTDFLQATWIGQVGVNPHLSACRQVAVHPHLSACRQVAVHPHLSV